MKTKLSTCFLGFITSFFLCISVYAQNPSYMTKNYYLNEFNGATIDDANSTLSGRNWANAIQSNGVLSLDVTGVKVYDGVLTIEFSSPIDVSENAMLTIEGMWENLVLPGLNEGVAIAPQLLIRLIDEDNNRTEGGNAVYSFGLPLNGDTWTTKTLDMKSYPEAVDFTRIKKITITYQAQSSGGTLVYESGRYLFTKVELGKEPEEGAKTEKSILTANSFLNNFTGPNISDENQITSGRSETATPMTQSDGRLDIHVVSGLGAWQTYFLTKFTNTIDISNENHQKAKIKFSVEGLVPTDVEEESQIVTLRMRLRDSAGTMKIIDLRGIGEGDHEYDLDYGPNTYSEPAGIPFDYTNIASFEIASSGQATQPGHIYLDHLQIGADIIPIDLIFESFTEENGLRIKSIPAAPLMEDEAFIIKDDEDGSLVENTFTIIDNGEIFNIQGDFNIENCYTLSLNDPLYYLEYPLTFYKDGSVKSVTVNLISASTDSIAIDFNRPVDLDESNFTLTNLETGEVQQFSEIRSLYSGQEYHLFAQIQPAVNYELKITAQGYSFGAPVSIRAGENPVNISVNWNNIVGQLTADHWGVNDSGPGITSVNDKLANFFAQIQPGVIRLHHAGLVASLVDNENRSWNRDKIRTLFENSKDTYKYGGRVMITFDACPAFISSTYPLTEAQEDELAEFFAEFPVIVKELGYYAEMYEFLNEKETQYANHLTEYWRMLNKVAIAIKAADSTVKCGGPAMSWPESHLYRGFIDNCADNMDFISYHFYARGPSSSGYPDDDLFTGGHAYRGQVNNVGAVTSYLQEKGITHLETFVDEFNVQYVWEPYEPAHHNYIGASWMACFIKGVALKNVTGLNVWNTQDGAYGLNYDTAPANLYLMSTKYLRGDVVDFTDEADRVEVIPVISSAGSKSVLLINRMGERTTVVNALDLIGGDETKIKAMRLDHTTLVEGTASTYVTEPIVDIPVDIVLNPYGMVLLTNVEPDPVEAPFNLETSYVLENEFALTWESNDITRKGFRILLNDEHIEDFQAVVDTTYVFNKLDPDTEYTVTLFTINEFGEVFDESKAIRKVTTRKMPLKVNDRTVGDGLHQFNYDKNWNAKASTTKIKGEVVYNGDLTTAKGDNSTVTLQFNGHTIAVYGLKSTRNNSVKISIDDNLQKEYLSGEWPAYEGLIYYAEGLSDQLHTLKIQTDATFSLDRVDVFGATFEDVTNAPEKVTDVEVLPTTNLISLAWKAPQHEGGIQYYKLIITEADSIRNDTVYSPEFTIIELEEETSYPVIIEAYDPCGNKSVSEEMTLSTIKKVSTPVAMSPSLITIDGVADEEAWSSAQRLDIVNHVDNEVEASDLSGWFRILWTERYLYININVTDDRKVARIEGDYELNENDGFELFIDGNNRKTGPYDLKDACVQALYSPVEYVEYNGVSTMEYAVADTEDGYSVEIRYNLVDLGMVPGAVGKEFGLDIHLNDNDKTDAAGLDNKLTWQANSANAASNKAFLGNMIFVNEINSIEKVTNSSLLRVYPNPVTDVLNIDTDQQEFEVRIIDNMGKIVLYTQNRNQIDVRSLADGMYVVQLKTAEAFYQSKFIKIN